MWSPTKSNEVDADSEKISASLSGLYHPYVVVSTFTYSIKQPILLSALVC